MRMRIYAVLVVDMDLSQWEWNQRIKLRLSQAAVHFTDHWAASQPLPQKENLTYLAWICVSICPYPPLAESAILFFYLPNCVCNTQCMRGLDGWIWGAVLLRLSFATVIGWLAVWTAVFRPGHLTWALTHITHCSSEERGDNKVKTSGSHNVQGTGWPAWPCTRG